MSNFIVNIDESNAAQLLIDESHQRPVVVDFWADWCEPCKVLMPLLEKIATEYNGAFLLAKVNADENPEIAQQFGVVDVDREGIGGRNDAHHQRKQTDIGAFLELDQKIHIAVRSKVLARDGAEHRQ